MLNLAQHPADSRTHPGPPETNLLYGLVRAIDLTHAGTLTGVKLGLVLAGVPIPRTSANAALKALLSHHSPPAGASPGEIR